MIHIAGLLPLTASYCRVTTALGSLHGPVIVRGVWLLHSPDLLVETVRRCMYCVKHPHTLEELRKKHSPRDFDNFRARTPESEQQLLPQLY